MECEELKRRLLLAEVCDKYGNLTLPVMPKPVSTDSKSWNDTGCFYFDYNKAVEIFFLGLKAYSPFLSWDSKKVLIFDRVTINADSINLHYHDLDIKVNNLKVDDLQAILSCQITSFTVERLNAWHANNQRLNLMIKRCPTSMILENTDDEEF